MPTGPTIYDLIRTAMQNETNDAFMAAAGDVVSEVRALDAQLEGLLSEASQGPSSEWFPTPFDRNENYVKNSQGKNIYGWVDFAVEAKKRAGSKNFVKLLRETTKATDHPVLAINESRFTGAGKSHNEHHPALTAIMLDTEYAGLVQHRWDVRNGNTGRVQYPLGNFLEATTYGPDVIDAVNTATSAILAPAEGDAGPQQSHYSRLDILKALQYEFGVALGEVIFDQVFG